MNGAAPQGPQFHAALQSLVATRGVLAAVLAAPDGLPVAIRVQSGHDGEAWAAAASIMGRLARKVLTRLSKGRLEVAFFDTEAYRFLLRPISLGYLLAVCAPDANVGLVSIEMETAAANLETLAQALHTQETAA
jgi:predicted regulator of Ras-like GTPase activity (Roadblock/LC7/MglB family)